jgi:hypothetical protein
MSRNKAIFIELRVAKIPEPSIVPLLEVTDFKHIPFIAIILTSSCRSMSYCIIQYNANSIIPFKSMRVFLQVSSPVFLLYFLIVIFVLRSGGYLLKIKAAWTSKLRSYMLVNLVLHRVQTYLA